MLPDSVLVSEVHLALFTVVVHDNSLDGSLRSVGTAENELLVEHGLRNHGRFARFEPNFQVTVVLAQLTVGSSVRGTFLQDDLVKAFEVFDILLLLELGVLNSVLVLRHDCHRQIILLEADTRNKNVSN